MLPVVRLQKRKLPDRQYRRRKASLHDAQQRITAPCRAVDEHGATLFVYAPLEAPHERYRMALKKVPYLEAKRPGGLKTVARTFGYHPRTRLTLDFCGEASLSWHNPHEHQLLLVLGQYAAMAYEKHLPKLFQEHMQTTVKNAPDWHIPGTPFTSGIANYNNALGYHYDSGNYPDVYSVMITYRNAMGGGWLVMPEYDVAVQTSDASVFMFDGQGILHGVSPLEPENPKAYRYTVVYYSLKGMWKCLPPKEELARAQRGKHE